MSRAGYFFLQVRMSEFMEAADKKRFQHERKKITIRMGGKGMVYITPFIQIQALSLFAIAILTPSMSIILGARLIAQEMGIQILQEVMKKVTGVVHH